jgi:hypothetical protein
MSKIFFYQCVTLNSFWHLLHWVWYCFDNYFTYFVSIFTIWKCIVHHRLCRDRIYFDKIFVSEYKLFKRLNKANFFNSPGPVACFSDEDDVSGNQNNFYWPLHNESIARCKHHMQEKLVYCCTYLVWR